MPQIVIPSSINTTFLAKLANLDGRWGREDDTPTTQIFGFMTMDIDAVEKALADYPAAYLAHRKNQKLEDLAAVRKTHEMNGPQGIYLDDKTVQRLTAAAVGLMIDTTRETVRWEMQRGVFATFTRTQVLGLAAASVGHVQACFDNVSTKTELINNIALDLENPTPLDTALDRLEEIDLTTGWPS